MIDAKAAFDWLSGDGVSEDRCTAVDIAAIEADLEGESNTSLSWILGDQQGQRRSHEVVWEWPCGDVACHWSLLCPGGSSRPGEAQTIAANAGAS